MENKRVIAEVENMVSDLELSLSRSKEFLKNISNYDSFSRTNRNADNILYLTECEAINEAIDKDIYDAIIRCKALSDIIESEIKSLSSRNSK